jgi:hypothetical protein
MARPSRRACSPIPASVSRSGPKKTTCTGAALDAMTSAPISLIVSRRMPGIVPSASACTPSMTCQMLRDRFDESTSVIIMNAELTDPML